MSDAPPAAAPPPPANFAFWNVNGLIPRLSTSTPLIKEFIQRHSPDIIFLSEVRMLAESPTSQATPSMRDRKAQEDKRAFDAAFSRTGPFANYKLQGLSLHPSKRYAGTLLAVKETCQQPLNVSYVIPGSSPKPQPSSSSPPQKTKSITSFFTPSTTSKKRPLPSSLHDPDGRVIFAEFTSFHILHAYVPNNGSHPTSWHRRKSWDTLIETFFTTVRSNSNLHPSSFSSPAKPVTARVYAGGSEEV
ncbi:hypothetical protein TrVE_jg12391 [Triparma verrucosa]|uniref:Uncharacterized protein n=1 Tax=Triparma verrucosa TaxID=1606542 RepID=A0A9W7FBG6_9STRA|nr:hypothetical protein TrVE_jg12391 [Triparma verrucosa]